MAARSKPTVYAALLRGINLGARNRLPMADLRGLVEDLGCTDVSTYVQSGNVVLRSDRRAPELAKAIEEGIRKSAGLDVPAVVRTAQQVWRLVDRNPFAGPKAAPNELHVTFLVEKPARERVRRLAERSFEPERFEIVGTDVYLSCPDGYGRSKLTNAMFERQLGVAATTRNWRTVCALAELAAAVG